MKDGILVLNKPQNWTSHDCVAICRRVLRLKGVKKIGHGGTLDPMAEGVLPIFIGQATRIMEYLELDDKTYICTARLGMNTDTQDIWGRPLRQRPFDMVTEEMLRHAIKGFTGHIKQIPPMYSAVRVDGKRLYEYAYKGKEVQAEIPPRDAYIQKLELLDVDLERGEFRFEITCSKGTYVRTICEDLGEVLGCGAVMTALQRTAVGNIGLAGSISPEDVKTAQAEHLEHLLLPPDHPLEHFGSIEMNEDRARYYRSGNAIWINQVTIREKPMVKPNPLTGRIPLNARKRPYDKIYKVYQEGSGAFLGTGFLDEDKQLLKADKVFTALNEPKKGQGTEPQ